MKRVVIVGATGMVGGYALRHLLDEPAVEQVTGTIELARVLYDGSPTARSRS